MTGTERGLVDAVAEVVGRLPPGHARAWAAVVRGSAGPHAPTLVAELLAARPGSGLAVLAERLVAAWRADPRVAPEAVALALTASAETRDRAMRHRSQIVVSGPRPHDVATRLTPSVISEAIGGARDEVLLVTFAASHAADAIAALRAAAERGVRIDVVLDDTTGARGAFRDLEGHARFWHWPEERRGAGGRAAMHAKLLVVDRSWAMVGSANLTARAMRDNLELGVILREPRVVARAVEHVHALMSPDGSLVRVFPRG